VFSWFQSLLSTFNWCRYSAEWQLLPNELHPPGTTVYKAKALQSPFPAFGPLQLVLDPGVSAVEFCLNVEPTGEWVNDGGRNFRITLGGATSVGLYKFKPVYP
jgi:alpha-glucan,water dikinase